MFWAGPNFLCQAKNLFTFSARQKDDLYSAKLSFCSGTKVFEEALNAVKVLPNLLTDSSKKLPTVGS